MRRQAPGDFGPYLGGLKVRGAVAGVSRVLPLGYAADHPPGTGRELALVRGAAPAGRAGLARGVAAVLRREQAAVAALRADLTARRDAAATALAFEIRGGRMCGWRQRPCTAAAARRYLEQSAPGWAPFARRSAELAARLRSPRAGLAARLRPGSPACAG